MSIGEPDGHYSFYNESRRVARKPHTCSACDRAIAPGDIYFDIRAGWEGIKTHKRCPPCQTIHEHLRKALPSEEWPAERLDCGHEYEELHGKPAPAWLQALAFWLPGDPLPALTLCVLLNMYAQSAGEQVCCYAPGFPPQPWPHKLWHWDRGEGSTELGRCMVDHFPGSHRTDASRPLPDMQLCEQVAS
jgi:hypothetical protein